jgi:hypothetical protein
MRDGRIDEGDRGLVGLCIAQVDNRNVQLFAEGPRDVVLGEQAAAHQRFTEALVVAGLFGEFHVFTRDRPGVHEEIADPRRRFAARGVRNENGRRRIG